MSAAERVLLEELKVDVMETAVAAKEAAMVATDAQVHCLTTIKECVYDEHLHG